MMGLGANTGAKVAPMAANSTHPDYDTSAVDWSRVRDVMAGEDAVKAAGEKYLPRLDSQTDEEFAAYVERASFFNATARTAEACHLPSRLLCEGSGPRATWAATGFAASCL